MTTAEIPGKDMCRKQGRKTFEGNAAPQPVQLTVERVREWCGHYEGPQWECGHFDNHSKSRFAGYCDDLQCPIIAKVRGLLERGGE